MHVTHLLLIVFAYLTVPAPVIAQFRSPKIFSREVALVVDNDQPFQTDQYYTAGQDFYYRFITDAKFPGLKKSDSSKTIVSLHYGNKVFNPKNIDTQDTRSMDRPYCGWNFISADIQHFQKRNVADLFAIQIGVVGKISGMGALQEWWHETIKLYPVEGWDSQIHNEVVVNLNYYHARAFSLGNGVEVISNSGAWLGTGSNKLTQEFTLRLLRFNPLRESSFLSARLAKGKNQDAKEFFFFAAIAGDLVFSNIFIQGSLFADNPSPFTTSINPWYITSRFGIQYSSSRLSASLSMVHLSKETPWVSIHDYASASLAYRY